MKTVDEGTVRTIDPRVANDMTMEAAIVMLEVARDLRSGVIPKDLFYMRNFRTLGPCGTSHCICGWVEQKLQKVRNDFINLKDCEATNFYRANGLHKGWPSRLYNLFGGYNQSDPAKAADAIENYLFNYADRPWG